MRGNDLLMRDFVPTERNCLPNKPHTALHHITYTTQTITRTLCVFYKSRAYKVWASNCANLQIKTKHINISWCATIYTCIWSRAKFARAIWQTCARASYMRWTRSCEMRAFAGAKWRTICGNNIQAYTPRDTYMYIYLYI